MEPKAKILIVEDEGVVGFDLKRILIELDYDVIDIIRTGEEAFVKAFESKPDLILMDIMLGGKINGIETAEQIKSSINVPIIYLTAYADNNTIQNAKHTEPFGYLLKPFEEKTLQTTIEMALYKFKMEIKLKESEKRYKQLAETLKEINEVKDNFFSILSHDLRSPFDSILGFTEILKNEYKDLSEEDRELYISSLYQSTRHVYNMLDNLLQYSRFQSGKVEFDPQEIHLEKIVNENVGVLKNMADKKNISIENKIENNLNVIADENMLNSIVLNLLTNAIKFTERGGQITISANKDDKSAEIFIADTGVGIGDETIYKLFTLDSSKSKAGTEKEIGTGLGLVLTKGYVEKNGGKIKVSSVINEGTTFSFSLPISN